MIFDGTGHVLLPLMALGMDMAFGDPRCIPHPVQGIGRVLDVLEQVVRKVHVSRFSGSLCLVLLLVLVWATAHWLVGIPVLGVLISLYLAWSGLALGSLLRECGKASQAIALPDIECGRAAVAMLVSRDVSQADRDALYRALAETLSENFNDGFVAPYFWLILGGPVGLWLYKAVSTMDSMWGYKTEKWRLLGWAGAKLDDMLAYIPARLAAFFLAVTGPVAGVAGRRSFIDLWQRVDADARTMESPNAGWPMAMAAWQHDRHMGGIAWYFGQKKAKPVLGPRAVHDAEGLHGLDAQPRVWDAEGIEALLRHVRIAAIAGGILLWLAGLLL